MFPEGPNGEYVPSYSVVTGCHAGGSPENKALMAEKVRKALTGPTRAQVEQWLARLSVITASRAASGTANKIKLHEYGLRLMAFPSDVVHHVLMERTWQFFPTWHELQQACERLEAPRRAMLRALESDQPEPEKFEPPTQDQKERVKSMIDELKKELSR